MDERFNKCPSEPSPPVGRNIARLRAERDWTQAHLADLIGVTQRTVQNWESTSPLLPKWDHLVKLAGAFGVSVAEFYERRAEDREPNDSNGDDAPVAA